MAKHYQELSNLQQNCVAMENTTHQRWKAPSTGTVKISFDGSLNLESRKGGIGVISRDAAGTLLGFYQTVIDGGQGIRR